MFNLRNVFIRARKENVESDMSGAQLTTNVIGVVWHFVEFFQRNFATFQFDSLNKQIVVGDRKFCIVTMFVLFYFKT